MWLSRGLLAGYLRPLLWIARIVGSWLYIRLLGRLREIVHLLLWWICPWVLLVLHRFRLTHRRIVPWFLLVLYRFRLAYRRNVPWFLLVLNRFRLAHGRLGLLAHRFRLAHRRLGLLTHGLRLPYRWLRLVLLRICLWHGVLLTESRNSIVVLLSPRAIFTTPINWPWCRNNVHWARCVYRRSFNIGAVYAYYLIVGPDCPGFAHLIGTMYYHGSVCITLYHFGTWTIIVMSIMATVVIVVHKFGMA